MLPARKGQEIREVGQNVFGQPTVEKARDGFSTDGKKTVMFPDAPPHPATTCQTASQRMPP